MARVGTIYTSFTPMGRGRGSPAMSAAASLGESIGKLITAGLEYKEVKRLKRLNDMQQQFKLIGGGDVLEGLKRVYEADPRSVERYLGDLFGSNELPGFQKILESGELSPAQKLSKNVAMLTEMVTTPTSSEAEAYEKKKKLSPDVWKIATKYNPDLAVRARNYEQKTSEAFKTRVMDTLMDATLSQYLGQKVDIPDLGERPSRLATEKITTFPHLLIARALDLANQGKPELLNRLVNSALGTEFVLPTLRLQNAIERTNVAKQRLEVARGGLRLNTLKAKLNAYNRQLDTYFREKGIELQAMQNIGILALGTEQEPGKIDKALGWLGLQTQPNPYAELVKTIQEGKSDPKWKEKVDDVLAKMKGVSDEIIKLTGESSGEPTGEPTGGSTSEPKGPPKTGAKLKTKTKPKPKTSGGLDLPKQTTSRAKLALDKFLQGEGK